MMRRTHTISIRPSASQNTQLITIAKACAKLWNEVTYRRRQSFFAGKINWDWADLYDKYKSTVGASTAQQIERKNSESWVPSLPCLINQEKKNAKKYQNHKTSGLLES